MSFVPPTSVAAGQVLTSARYNQDVVANTQALKNLTGLVLLFSQSFSSVTSISVNNCFSSAFDNYRIVCFFTPPVSVALVTIRFRSGTTDNTDPNYSTKRLEHTGAAVTPSAQNNADQGNIGNTTSGGNSPLVADIFAPFIGGFTSWFSTASQGSGSNVTGNIYHGNHSGLNIFDGFSLLFPSAGGNISVYGYNK
jgi:hypothetical protein